MYWIIEALKGQNIKYFPLENVLSFCVNFQVNLQAGITGIQISTFPVRHVAQVLNFYN